MLIFVQCVGRRVVHSISAWSIFFASVGDRTSVSQEFPPLQLPVPHFRWHSQAIEGFVKSSGEFVFLKLKEYIAHCRLMNELQKCCQFEVAEFWAVFVELPGGEGVVFVEPELGRVVTQRLGSGRVLAVDSSDLIRKSWGLGVGCRNFWPWPCRIV